MTNPPKKRPSGEHPRAPTGEHVAVDDKLIGELSDECAALRDRVRALEAVIEQAAEDIESVTCGGERELRQAGRDIGEQLRHALTGAVPEDRSIPPEHYSYGALWQTDDEGEEHVVAYTVNHSTTSSMEHKTAEEAIAACWEHRDAVLASSRNTKPTMALQKRSDAIKDNWTGGGKRRRKP